MEDIKILEAVESYIAGAMSPDERVYFEQLRKTNPEIDQLVVEHTFFLQQLSRFDDVKKFKGLLNDTHIGLAGKGHITSPKLEGKARIVHLYNRYKRVAAIAASIAGITALTISALVWSLSPAKPVKDEVYTNFSRELIEVKKNVKAVEQKNQELTQKINDVQDQATPPVNIEYRRGGTGFLIDAKGYLVTNAHIVENSEHVAVQSSNGDEYRAVVVYTDSQRDISILKINDKAYKPSAALPYSIRRTASDLAEPIFTLGYPRNDIVYGDGYIAARTGDNGDTLTCQISIPANKGNSGSPILNRNGEVIGILKKGNTAEGVAFAIQSKYIHAALTELQKDTAYRNVKIPASSNLKGRERTQQVKTVADFVFMVKVD